MAIRLAKAFGSNPDQWMRMQFAYDSAKAEERAKKIKVKLVKLELEPAYQ
jgi:plasmid maintenance system antidote protein VapI